MNQGQVIHIERHRLVQGCGRLCRTTRDRQSKTGVSWMLRSSHHQLLSGSKLGYHLEEQDEFARWLVYPRGSLSRIPMQQDRTTTTRPPRFMATRTRLIPPFQMASKDRLLKCSRERPRAVSGIRDDPSHRLSYPAHATPDPMGEIVHLLACCQ